MNIDTLALLTGIMALGFVSQLLAWRLKLPAILFLLIIGLVAGPTTGILDPDVLFGELLFPIVSLSVAIILFEGSLTLQFNEVREVGGVIQRLVSIGAIITWLATSVITHWAINCSWEVAFLFGAITVVTGPTVILPLLRAVRPTTAIANILRWEGIIIDPIGAIFAVLVYEFIASGATGGSGFGASAMIFGEILLVGFLFGGLGGQLIGTALRKHWLPEYLHNFGALALLLGLFTLSNGLAEESGLLTVTVMGIWLANMKGVDTSDLLNFKESLSLLLISGLFIILAARIEWSDFANLGWGAVIVLLGMQLVARPLSVGISMIGSNLNWREFAMIAWIAPRGIVAAAISSLFALHLQKVGVPQAEVLVPLTFLVIIATVVLQSITARPLAMALKVAEPDGHGFLIIGANDLAIAIGKALTTQGVRVLLADSNWESTRKARMEDLPVYYGNALSEHADRHLNLIGLTGLLALSWRSNINSLACLRFRPEFGAASLFSLTVSKESDDSEASRYDNLSFGQTLFSDQASFKDLSARLKAGETIRATRLTEQYDYKTWLDHHGEKATPMFAVSASGRTRVFSANNTFEPKSGSILISLSSPDE